MAAPGDRTPRNVNVPGTRRRNSAKSSPLNGRAARIVSTWSRPTVWRRYRLIAWPSHSGQTMAGNGAAGKATEAAPDDRASRATSPRISAYRSPGQPREDSPTPARPPVPAAVEHRGGTAERLLGGLEDEHRGTGEPVAQPRQYLRDTHSDGGVQIVSTQVGQLGAAADLLIRRYRVHVRPVGHRPTVMGAGEDSHDAVPADARGDVETGRAKSPRDHRGGAYL